MRLGERHTKRRSRASEVISSPERVEEFDAGKIIRQVIAIANERLGGISELRVSPESIFLVQAAFPNILSELIPKPIDTTFWRRAARTPLEEATLLLASAGSNPYQWDEGQLENLFKRASDQIRDYTGTDESPVRLVKSTVFLARFIPEKMLELAQLLRRIQPEILSMLDDDALDPNYQRPAIAGMLRLLDPAVRLSLQEIVEPRLPAWKEEVGHWLSPEMVSKYTNRGLQHYLDQALQAAAGIEIVTAQEAYISDTGELVVVSARPLIQPGQPLPDRELA